MVLLYARFLRLQLEMPGSLSSDTKAVAIYTLTESFPASRLRVSRMLELEVEPPHERMILEWYKASRNLCEIERDWIIAASPRIDVWRFARR